MTYFSEEKGDTMLSQAKTNHPIITYHRTNDMSDPKMDLDRNSYIQIRGGDGGNLETSCLHIYIA